MTVAANHTGNVVPFMQPTDVVPLEYRDRLRVYTTTDPVSPEWAAVAEVESQIFIDSGYVKSAQEIAEHYAPFESVSEMIGLEHLPKAHVLGGSRVADPHPELGHKTVQDIDKGELKVHAAGAKALSKVDHSRMMSVDTISLERRYRGAASAGYVGLLYSAQYIRAVNNGHTHIIASMDANYWGGFHRRFEHFAEDLGPAVMYMGSLTVPILMDVAKISLEDFKVRRQRPAPVAQVPTAEAA